MTSASELAKYIINFPNIEVDNLKLQKLLFYCQAVSLGLNGEAIFEDKIEAWDYGPVVPVVYHNYKQNENKVLEKSENEVNLSDHDIEMADLALEHYGSMSGARLIQLTHSEKPWQDAYRQGRNTEITQQSMKDFYSKIYSI